MTATPGPKGSFLLGNLREFLQDMLGFFTRSARRGRGLVLTYQLIIFRDLTLCCSLRVVTENRFAFGLYALRNIKSSRAQLLLV